QAKAREQVTGVFTERASDAYPSARSSPRCRCRTQRTPQQWRRSLRRCVDLSTCRLEPPLKPIEGEIAYLLRVLAVFSDDLVASQQHQHGHAGEAETLAVGLVGVVIELHDVQVGVLSHPAIDHWSDLVAGRTPRCPVVAELQLGTRRCTTENADENEEQGRAPRT